MNKLAIAALLAATTTGCSIPLLDTPQPAQAPNSTDVLNVVNEANMLSRNTTPIDFTAAGYYFVEKKCGDFFDKLTLYKTNSKFWSTEIATAGAGAAGILALLSASTTVTGIVGLGAGLAAATVMNFENFATVTPYPLETRELVFAALSTARNAKPAANIVDFYDAQSTVAAYAHYCTYAGIATLSQQAIQSGAANTTVKDQAVPSVIRDSIRAMVGEALSDTQIAWVVVLADGDLNADQRATAVKSASFTKKQAVALIDNTTNMLTQVGKNVAGTGTTTAALYPAFAKMVTDNKATALKAATPAAIPAAAPNFAPDLIQRFNPPNPGGTASPVPPQPTPSVVIGR